MVRRVLTNSRGYVKRVWLTPAQAPASNEAGIGIFDCSPCSGDSFLFTVSNTKSYTYKKKREPKAHHFGIRQFQPTQHKTCHRYKVNDRDIIIK